MKNYFKRIKDFQLFMVHIGKTKDKNITNQNTLLPSLQTNFIVTVGSKQNI